MMHTEYGMPSWMSENLLWMNQTPPELPKGDYLNYPEKGYPLDEDLAKLKIENGLLGGLHGVKYVQYNHSTLDTDLFQSAPESIFATSEYKEEFTDVVDGIKYTHPQRVITEVPLKEPRYVGIILKKHFEEYGFRTEASHNFIKSKLWHGQSDPKTYFVDLYYLHQPMEDETLFSGKSLTGELQSQQNNLPPFRYRRKPLFIPEPSSANIARFNSELSLQGYSSYKDSSSMSSFIHETKEKFRFEGFPQGSPISPLLCSMILGGTIFNQGMCTMYADDGIFYGKFNTETVGNTTAEMAKFNLSFAAEKSSWVKQDGKWLKPLKYLGLIFDPFAKNGKGELKAATKKGATLIFDKEELIMALNQELQEEGPKTRKPIYYKNTEETLISKECHKIYNTVKALVLKENKFFSVPGPNFNIVYNDRLKRGDGFTMTPPESSVSEFLFIAMIILQTVLTSEVSHQDTQLYWITRIIDFLCEYDTKSEVIEELRNSQSLMTFNWKLLVKSRQFGFVLSRLYQDSWNSKVEQNFHMEYRPESWAWYALRSQSDLQTVPKENYPLNPREISDEPRESEGTFFNPHVTLSYGYLDDKSFQDLHKDKKMSKEIFFQILNGDTSWTVKKSKLQVRVTPKYGSPFISNKAHLSVFNSTSYALPSLVNLFRLQQHLDTWRQCYKALGLTVTQIRKLVQLLRQGMNPVNLYRQLVVNPHELSSRSSGSTVLELCREGNIILNSQYLNYLDSTEPFGILH